MPTKTTWMEDYLDWLRTNGKQPQPVSFLHRQTTCLQSHNPLMLLHKYMTILENTQVIKMLQLYETK